MDLSKSLKLLESQDSRSYEDARLAIVTQLDQGNGIKQVLHYYAQHRSERALELLCCVSEPHDKIMMHELSEIFPHQTLNTIILLGQMLQQGPPWVPKIIFNTLFQKVTGHIMRKKQKERIVVEDIAVLLFISAILPVCSALTESLLKVLSQLFICASEQLRQRMRSDAKVQIRDDINEIHLEHFHYALKQYFMVLYGMYPNYFIAFLKEYFLDENDDAKQKIYRAIVEPMLTQVKLHPGLLTLTRKSELLTSRWHNREPHDFLHDCRQTMMGMIPPSGDLKDAGLPSEAEDTSTVMSDVYRQLFPSKSSGSTSNDAWENASADHEVEAALMRRIDTPPGTRSHTPKGARDVRSLDEPMVLDGKRRRSTGPSEHGEKGRKSFSARVGKLFTRSNNRVNESFHEEVITGVELDGARRNSELEEAEDAMDAIDAERVETPHVEAAVVVSPASLAEKQKAEAARAAVRSLRGSMRTTPQKGARGSTGASAAAAAAAAMLQTTPAASEEDGHGGVSRSRSTSFLTTHSNVHRLSGRLDHSVEEEGEERATATTDRSENTGSAENLLRDIRQRDEVGPLGGDISASLPERRGYPDQFFYTMNRQRYFSECPPAEGEAEAEAVLEHVDGWMEQRRVIEGLKNPGGDAAGDASKNSTLKRTSSLPAIVDPEKRKRELESGEEDGMTTSGAGGPEYMDRARERENLLAPPDMMGEKKKRGKRLIEYFPYLAIIKEPCQGFYECLEEDLERHHERNRAMYMKESNNFHAKLKEMNMADRLPGKIYDDLSHILKGLPVDKQVIMLQARLSLVNQHLLYERSCRLLHANRNRRLFGRIKQQKIYEAELRMFREKDVRETEERREMIKAMSDYRKQLITLKSRLDESNSMLSKETARRSEEMDSLVFRTAEAERLAKLAMADRERWRVEHDGLQRRAEDAEVELQMMEEKFETARKECVKQQAAVAQLEQTVDDLQIAERRRREEGGGGAASPCDFMGDERVRELEAALERSRAEIEKMRREMEMTTTKRDEAERALKHETNKTHDMRYKLDRSSRLLNEQREAAECKYKSLQMIVRKQEEYIAELFTVVEEAEENRRKGSIASDNGGGERRERSADSSLSSEPVRSPPRRSVLPDKYISDEMPRHFFLMDPLNAIEEQPWVREEPKEEVPPFDSGLFVLRPPFEDDEEEEEIVLPEEKIDDL